MDDPNTKKDRIDALNRTLYMRDESKVRKTRTGIIHAPQFEVAKEWNVKDETPLIDREPHIAPSMFKKFFIASIIFFVLAIGFAAFKFFGGSNTVSNDNIDIAVLGNAFTPGGEELPLQIEIKNGNAVPLEFSNLKVEYPKGGNEAGGAVERKNIAIGTIKSGDTHVEDLRLTLFGEQGSTKTIKSTLEYRVKGSNAIFVKEKSYTVSISSAPLNLTVSAPTTTAANQNIVLDFKTVLGATVAPEKTILKVTYPPGFEFKDASPKPILSNNVWLLSDLKQGVETKVSIQGTLAGQDGEDRSFRAYVGSQNPKDEANVDVIYSSLLHTIKIERPFIEARIAINGQEKEEFSSGQGQIRGEIIWTNNLPTRVDNLEIYAKFSGSSFNKESVTPSNGFYDSLNSQIIWDRNSNQEFASVDPGETGKVAFTIVPLPTYNGTSSIPNPQIVIDVSVKGTQPNLANTTTTVDNFVRRVIKINTDLQLTTAAYYFSGPFTNTGPIPPKAEQATTYTITWSLVNSANRINNAEVKATLPSGVTWMNSVSPASSSGLTYDNGSRTVTWKAGTVNPGAGLSGGPKEVSFQVRLIPSLNQVGSVAPLIDKTTLTGQDSFTGAALQSVKAGLNTRLSNDPNFTAGMEKVIR